MVFLIYKNGMCGCQGFRITIVATHPPNTMGKGMAFQWYYDLLGWHIQAFKKKKIMFNPDFGHYYYECMVITRSLCH